MDSQSIVTGCMWMEWIGLQLDEPIKGKLILALFGMLDSYPGRGGGCLTTWNLDEDMERCHGISVCALTRILPLASSGSLNHRNADYGFGCTGVATGSEAHEIGISRHAWVLSSSFFPHPSLNTSHNLICFEHILYKSEKWSIFLLIKGLVAWVSFTVSVTIQASSG